KADADMTPFTAIPNDANVIPPPPPDPVSAATCSSKAPSAALMTTAPQLNSIVGTEGLDMASAPYYAVTNGCVQADITITKTAGNGGQGTFKRGWLGDFFLTDNLRQEEFDWSELDLTTKDYVAGYPADTGHIWNITNAQLPLPNLSVENGD